MTCPATVLASVATNYSPRPNLRAKKASRSWIRVRDERSATDEQHEARASWLVVLKYGCRY
jgi:hypothetical protein